MQNTTSTSIFIHATKHFFLRRMRCTIARNRAEFPQKSVDIAPDEGIPAKIKTR
jgi:hypothetical protein